MKRKYQLLELVDNAAEISIKELAEAMAVSEVTIRKDVNQLLEEGLIFRRNGMVSIANAKSMEAKIAHHYLAKHAIVKKAADLINDGDIIFVDEGSTNALFAKEILVNRDIHVITNSLYIANILAESQTAQLTFIGGTYDSKASAFAGPVAKMVLAQLAIEKVFVGANGYSAEMGFTCNNFAQVEISTVATKHAQDIYVLADAGKFAAPGLTTLVSTDKISAVVTNTAIPATIQQDLAQQDVVVITVD